MSKATQAQANEYIAVISRHFGTVVVTKKRAMEMQLIAAAFNALRAAGRSVPAGNDFLDNYSTTLGTIIYMPEPSESFDPDAQIATVTHETEHAIQFLSSGHGLPSGLGMMWLYLISPENRVQYEARAYRAGAEIEFAMKVRVETPDEIAGFLEHGYEVDLDSARLAKDLMKIALTSVNMGIVSTDSARFGIAWLRQNYPELLR